jgi:hypothetical protein
VLTGAGLANLGCAVFTATEAGNKTVDKKAGTIAALSSVSAACQPRTGRTRCRLGAPLL